MSSHHIVKDQQEPALLLHQLTSQQLPLLGQLLEWSPTVLACEQAILAYTYLGYKLDVGLISFHRQDYWHEELSNQSPIRIFAVDNQVSAAIDLLSRENHRAVNVITDESSFHDMLQMILNVADHMDIVLYTENDRHVLQKQIVYEKWIPSGQELSILPLKEGNTISTIGFDKNIENEEVVDEVVLHKSKEGVIQIKSDMVPYLVSEKI